MPENSCEKFISEVQKQLPERGQGTGSPFCTLLKIIAPFFHIIYLAKKQYFSYNIELDILTSILAAI